MIPLPTLAALARTSPGAPPVVGASCELCGQPLGEEHRHLLDVQGQQPCCACRACALLFTTPAPGSRYRTVEGRVRVDAGLRIEETQWQALQIPVRLAFFHCDDSRSWTATYPGAAGPLRAAIDPAAWAPLAAAPLVKTIAPLVEALLVWSRRPSETFACFAVPIDRCFALAGLLRRHWRGFSGGPVVWREVDSFFSRLRSEAVPL